MIVHRGGVVFDRKLGELLGRVTMLLTLRELKLAEFVDSRGVVLLSDELHSLRALSDSLLGVHAHTEGMILGTGHHCLLSLPPRLLRLSRVESANFLTHRLIFYIA